MKIFYYLWIKQIFFFLQASINPPLVERQDSSTQTDPSCLSPFAASLPTTSCSSASDRILPPPPLHYTTVAVVESDPDRNSHQSSPSQTSKTESAHGDRLANAIAANATATSDSKASLDFDQRSDYDNNFSDSAEPNNNAGGDGDGGKLDSSSDTDSEDSSSISEERALFLSLKNQNPSRSNLNKSGHGGEGEMGDMTAWHDFAPSAPPPPPTSPFSSDHYAFNPYAIDDDIIHNQPLTEREQQQRGRHGYDSQLVDGIMYDPDPDATPVWSMARETKATPVVVK